MGKIALLDWTPPPYLLMSPENDQHTLLKQRYYTMTGSSKKGSRRLYCYEKNLSRCVHVQRIFIQVVLLLRTLVTTCVSMIRQYYSKIVDIGKVCIK